EPIAIIGTACRLPGKSNGDMDVESTTQLWDFLQQQQESYSDFPPSRLNLESWVHPTENRPGSFYTRGGAFLKRDPRLFDPSFFGIHPKEATSMDPAQRKFLEVVYEAVESSGTPLERLSGSKTGCFVGNFNYDHQLMQYRDTEYPEPYAITGGGIALLSNRVSYVFNLQGPSLTLDVACSSSMYALHLACTAIQTGECTAAIVGGSNLILTPECQMFSAALGAVSRTSQCHTFDAAADGYARADGLGVLFVKSLKQAIRDRDPIRAVIRGTAINANGRTGGITHPDPDGQEAAIRRAYHRAGLDPSQTSYLECHGTGTPVGDPLEVEAVGRVFETSKTAARPLLIGSIKSNMGHPESASGVAGILKVVAAFEHDMIPPIRRLKQLNPNINLRHGRLQIVEKSTSWPALLRRASVNSFGYGGANGHAIIEAADNLAPGCAGIRAGTTESVEIIDEQSDRIQWSQRKHFLLPISAHNERTLQANFHALSEQAHRWKILDLAYTLRCRRTNHTTRAVALGEEGQIGALLYPPRKTLGSQTLRLAMVFTGQGAQWPQMGLQLMESFPTYLKSIRDMDDVLHSIRQDAPSWSIEAALRAPAETSLVYRAELSQPLVTAVQVALVDLLNSWNIRPVATVGHSSGEIAAAYAAGRISAAQAILAAYVRGWAVAQNPEDGAMLAVGASADDLVPVIDSLPSLCIACHNSPESVTVSGNRNQIERLKLRLEQESVFARILPTGGNAYHSSHMQALGNLYEERLVALLAGSKSLLLSAPTQAECPFFSSVTGTEYAAGQGISAQYWRRNLESPVLFHQAVATMVQHGEVDALVEVGPHAALQGPLRQIGKSFADTSFPDYIPTMIRKQDAAANVLQMAGLLFTRGHPVDLARLNSMEGLDCLTNSVTPGLTGRVIVDLPRYQWQYGDLLYRENRWTREWRLRTHPRHDLLGSRTPGGNRNEPTWRNVLKHKDLPWLQDHKVENDIVFPTTGYIGMTIEALMQMGELRKLDQMVACYEIHEFQIETALVLPAEADVGVELLFNLRPISSHLAGEDDGLTYSFTITSVLPSEKEDVFTRHVHGQATIVLDKTAAHDGRAVSSPDVSSALHKDLNVLRWYDAFERVGLNYGSTFRGLSNLRLSHDPQSVTGQFKMHPTTAGNPHESRYLIHPAALDSSLQLAIVAGHHGRASACTSAFLPVSIGKLLFWPQDGTAAADSIAAASARVHPGGFSAVVTISSGDGTSVVGSDIRFKESEGTGRSAPDIGDDPYTQLVWKPDVKLLTSSAANSLFPSQPRQTHSNTLPLLDQLALHQIIQFRTQYPGVTEPSSAEPHLRRFLSWMDEKVAWAAQGHFPGSAVILNYSLSEREREIRRLEAQLLASNGPETRLMCRMYESLPAIYRGEITGIHAAVQDDLLNQMYAHMELYHQGSVALKDLVVLLSHKNPRSKILEVGGGTGSATREVLPALNGHTDAYRGYDTYTFTDIGPAFLAAAQEQFQAYRGVRYTPYDMQKPVTQQTSVDADYDLVIASNVIHATTHIQNTLCNIRGLLRPGGKLVLFEFVRPQLSWNMILGTFSDFWNGDHDPVFPRLEGPFLTRAMWEAVLPRAGFSGIDLMLDHFTQQGEAAVILATAVERTEVAPPMPSPKRISLVYRDQPSAVVQGVYQHLHCEKHQVDMLALGPDAQPDSDRLVFLIDVDRPFFPSATKDEWDAFRRLVGTAYSALYVTRGGLLDHQQPEYAMISGIVCAIHAETQASRLVTLDLDCDGDADVLSEQDLDLLVRVEEKAFGFQPGDDFEFRARQGTVHVSRLAPDDALNSQYHTSKAVPFELRHVPAHCPGQILAWSSQGGFRSRNLGPLGDDEVEISIRAIEHSDPPGFVIGCAGIVTSTAAAATGFQPGDRVSALLVGDHQLQTTVRAHASLCHRLSSQLAWAQGAMLAASVTALYALHDLGRLCSGETVLVGHVSTSHMAAAFHIAQQLGARAYIGVTSDDAFNELVHEWKIPADRLVRLTDASRAADIVEKTGGLLDIIYTDSFQPIYSAALVPLGRFIYQGADGFDGRVFKHGVSVSPIDLRTLHSLRPEYLSGLVARLHNMHSSRPVQPLSVSSMSMTGFIEKLREDPTTTTSTTVTLDPTSDLIPCQRASPGATTIRSDASYLLVGCLGGLGRSFVQWLVAQGAQSLVFLSRGGVQGAEASALIDTLTRQAVDVQIVQGDVCNLADVQRAVQACRYPLQGVIQAALTLHDAFFSELTWDDFQATVQPRVQGTQNLHLATKGLDLQFFVAWSSWTTLFGSASQSNYMAANAFLDAFAGYRRRQGLPGTSLSLGQILDVGIVSYHPQFQEHLMRMGLYGNTEAEFLDYCAQALALSGTSTSNPAHLLAGVQPLALLAHSQRYPVDQMPWYHDPRFARLAQSTEHLRAATTTPNPGLEVGMMEDENLPPVARIHRQLARLLYVDVQDMDVQRPIKSYGIDSMVAAELRNWIFRVFHVDVSLLRLLNPTMTMQGL
ncbi:type I polyketide synthase, partial [Aspergillus saccharolyticus JOP 1030-1]